MASSFKVTGEEASTRIDVGFRGGSCVGRRGGTKGRRETRRCHGRGSGTRSLSEGKKVEWEGIVHLATWCFVKCRGRKIEGAERAIFLARFFFFFFLYHVFVVKVQELACSASYGVNKTTLLAPGKKPSTQVPLVWNQPHTSHIK